MSGNDTTEKDRIDAAVAQERERLWCEIRDLANATWNNSPALLVVWAALARIFQQPAKEVADV